MKKLSQPRPEEGWTGDGQGIRASVRAGESVEFDEFIRRHGEKAFNFACRLSGNEQDARDLVQEALSRAWAHRDRYDESRPFESWLCRILQNIYLDEVRRRARRKTVSLDAPAPSEESEWVEILPGRDGDPSDSLVRGEEDALLQAALDSLPVAYRTAVILCDIEGLAYDRIGEVMECPIGTVRSRIHQGRVLLRKALEESERYGRRLQ